MLRPFFQLTAFLSALVFSAHIAMAQMPSSSDIDWAWDAFADNEDRQALDILERAANAGDAASQTMIAWAYEIGKVLPRDTQQAIYWYQEAAIQDHPEAFSSLGLMYYYGREDLSVDYNIAAAYYEAGMALDDPESFSFLGYMYQQGDGVPQDYTRAAELYLRAADLGDGYGAAQYGWLLREGLGVAVDNVAARDYYQRALDEGYEAAYDDLAHMLHRGLGGEVDLQKALNLYILAIENDVPYGGIGAAYLILENPEEFPDPVMGLSLCYWAIENAEADYVAEYREDCDYWEQDFKPEEIARAHQMMSQY